MKNSYANSTRMRRTRFFFVAILLLAVAAQARAQVEQPRTGRGGGLAGTDESNVRHQRIFLERTLNVNARRSAAIINKRSAEEEARILKVRQQLIFDQVRKDYRSIQVLNNRMNAALGGRAPDYAGISRDAAEIARCACRLKHNLALPATAMPTGQQTYVDGLALAPMLRVLDTRVLSFINNPFFKNPTVIDVEMTGKARRDLEDIIGLSRDIRRNAVRTRDGSVNTR